MVSYRTVSHRNISPVLHQMTQASLEDVTTITFSRYEGIIVCVIRVEFRSTNTGGIKTTCVVRVYFQLYFSNLLMIHQV